MQHHPCHHPHPIHQMYSAVSTFAAANLTPSRLSVASCPRSNAIFIVAAYALKKRRPKLRRLQFNEPGLNAAPSQHLAAPLHRTAPSGAAKGFVGAAAAGPAVLGAHGSGLGHSGGGDDAEPSEEGALAEACMAVLCARMAEDKRPRLDFGDAGNLLIKNGPEIRRRRVRGK